MGRSGSTRLFLVVALEIGEQIYLHSESEKLSSEASHWGTVFAARGAMGGKRVGETMQALANHPTPLEIS